MASQPVLCPICNAALQPTADDLAHPRIACPRCGESFANRDYSGLTASASAVSKETGLTATPETAKTETGVTERPPAKSYGLDISLRPPARKPMSNGKIARIILCGMICVGVIGGIYALSTVTFRRENDRKGKTPEASGEQVIARLLPDKCRVVAGWDVAKMRETPEGGALLKQIADGKADFGLSRLKQWTGLTVNEVEQLAFGVRVREQLPSFTLVVHTAKPYELEKIAEAAGHPKPDNLRTSRLFPVRLEAAGEALIWCLDQRTIVIDVHLRPAGMKDHIDLTLRTWRDHKTPPFTPLIRAGLREQRQLKGTALWIAGDLETAQSLAKHVNLLPKDQKDLFSNIETFHFGLRVTDEIGINGAIKATDKKAAGRIQKWLEQTKPESTRSFSVVGPHTKLRKGMVPDPTLVTLQMRFDVNRGMEAIGSVLRRK